MQKIKDKKKFIPPEKYLLSLPAKRISAGALFFNKNNELLIIKPNYKNHWSIPGGVVERDESPLDGCIREIKEEIGLKINRSSLKLAGVVYVHQKELGDESLQLFFHGGTLNISQISKIKLSEDEIETCKFVKIKDVIKYNKSIGSKLKSCLKAASSGNSISFEQKRDPSSSVSAKSTWWIAACLASTSDQLSRAV